MLCLIVANVFLHPSSAAQTGGTISNYHFASTLAKKNRVIVLSFGRQCGKLSGLNVSGVELVNFPAPVWKGINLMRNWNSFVISSTLEVIEKHGRPDVIFATTSTLSAFDVTSPNLGMNPRIKKVAIIQAYENFGVFAPKETTFSSKLALAKSALIRRFQDRRLLHSADCILTNSKFMEKAVSSRFGIDKARIFVMPQLCDIQAGSVRAPSKNSVGFVNRGSEKNFKFLKKLAIFAPDLEFVVYGHTHDIGLELPNNVNVIGWEACRLKMFSSAALWIVPSVWPEPFGRVSIEAQAADRPVLVANRGGLPETVFDENYKIGKYEKEAWVDRMRLLLDYPENIVNANSERVRETFSHARYMAAIKEVEGRLTG